MNPYKPSPSLGRTSTPSNEDPMMDFRARLVHQQAEAAERRMARALVAAGEFIEVFVDTPLALAEARDAKGLYKKARRGELKNFTGIDSPYEAPEDAEIRLDTTQLTPEAAALRVIAQLRETGIIDVDSSFDI